MTDCITLLKDSLTSISKLEDADAGALLKALISHANGEVPDLEDESVIVQALYPLIAGQLDRSAELRERRSSAGKKGGASKTEANDKQTESKREANVKQTESKREAQEQEHIQEHKEKGAKAPKEKGFAPPAEPWQEFVEMRKKIKKPMTGNAETRMLARLEKLCHGDEELAGKILLQSVDHCWQDVYELKSGPPGKTITFNFDQRSTNFDELLAAKCGY